MNANTKKSRESSSTSKTSEKLWKIIRAIVPARHINELSQPFVKFQGLNPYELIKNIKERYVMRYKARNVGLKEIFNERYYSK